MSAARFGAVAMEIGAGSGGTPLFLVTTPCLRLFLASVYLSLGLQGSGVELALRTPGEVTTELGLPASHKYSLGILRVLGATGSGAMQVATITCRLPHHLWNLGSFPCPEQISGLP